MKGWEVEDEQTEKTENERKEEMHFMLVASGFIRATSCSLLRILW